MLLFFRHFIRKFPKFFLVTAVLITSTTLFGIWWIAREAAARRPQVVAPDIRPQIALFESKPERLLFVDNVLYDLDTGEVVFKEWLEDERPQALFFDGKSKKIIARFKRGFVRYSLDGKVEATLIQRFQPAFTGDLKTVIFSKEKDIWRADMDWDGFRFLNERQVTSISQFNDQHFAENIILWTDKFLLVRQANNLLRVDLESGSVKPARVPLKEYGKRRSPNGRYLVGLQNGHFYCYDIEADEPKTLPFGRNAINDYQWLGNDFCTAIVRMKAVVLYDREKNSLTEIADAPPQTHKLGEPSPGGRFVFGLAPRSGAVFDLEKNTVLPVTGGAGIRWVSNDTFAFSREIPDSESRGSWLQTVGEGERRISPEPYLVSKAGGMVLPIERAGVVILVTTQGLSRMKPDGSELKELVKLARPPSLALLIQEWRPAVGRDY